MAHVLDWNLFTEKELAKANKDILNGTVAEYEDILYGYILLALKDKDEEQKFIIDVHYSYYNSREKYFDLEVYEQKDDEGHHGKWIDSISNIISAKDYGRFQKRAEREILSLLERWNYVKVA